jgi:hypothetical protein
MIHETVLPRRRKVRCVLFVAITLCTAVIAMPSREARADAQSCIDLRAKIVAMDATSSNLPGYLPLRAQLASLYKRLCSGDSPTQAQEYWYSLDGKKLGPVEKGRPDKAAYATTDNIGRACASAVNPSMCALSHGAFSLCANPPDAETTAGCKVLGAYPTVSDSEIGSDAPPLPPLTVTLDGQSFTLPTDCANVLANIAEDPPENRQKQHVSLRYKMLDQNRIEILQGSCPDFLAALEHRLGRSAAQDPSQFWPALYPVVTASFPPPGAVASASPAMPLAICEEAQSNMNMCKQRWNEMGAVGEASHGTSGQAAAFRDCYLLYEKVVGMCRISNKSLPRSSPQTAQSGLSPQCQTLVQNYIAAAQANDGPKALAGYHALKQAGGCGVLGKVDRPMPTTSADAPSVDDPRFVSRGATPLSDAVVGGCDAAPDVCAARVRELRAGVSPEAIAALYSNAIGIGLELGTMMGNAMLSGVPTTGGFIAGGGTNMNSIGNRPVRHTYGQGSPARQAPAPTHQGCVECNVGTAQ